MFWLFAMVAGVVNACLLTPPTAPERSAAFAGIAALDAHADAGTGARAGIGHGGHHDQVDPVRSGLDGQSGNVSCLKFCGDESSAMTKAKLPVDLSLGLLTLV